jgi:hypothetical protein
VRQKALKVLSFMAAGNIAQVEQLLMEEGLIGMIGVIFADVPFLFFFFWM